MNVIEELKAASAAVAARAKFVRLNTAALEPYAQQLAREPVPPLFEVFRLSSDEQSVAFSLIVNSINFGSGYSTFWKKRPGCGFFFSVTEALREYCESRGVPDALRLGSFGIEELAAIFGQDAADTRIRELLDLYRTAWRQLSSFIAGRHGGSFLAPVEAAGGSAVRFADQLREMPFFNDVHMYERWRLPFLKRAQIAAADIAGVLGGTVFDDIERLTIFADNKVPHVLRMDGILCYEEPLRERIDAGIELVAGSAEELELRACAVHACEELSRTLTRLGTPRCASQIDAIVWSRGQGQEYKRMPSHKTRSVFY